MPTRRSDGAYLAKAEVVDNLRGLGTGQLDDSMNALVQAGVPIYVSGMSAKGRGVTDGDLERLGATFAMPAKLVDLTFENERVLVY
ncbi:MAG: DsrE family protein [Actinomycetota bacterium]